MDTLRATLTFVTVALLTLAVLAERASAHHAVEGGWRRKGLNYALGIVGALIARVLVPVSVAAVAEASREAGSGVLAALPDAAAIAAYVIVMDFAMYAQHRAFHEWRFLWRFHAPHHADSSIDVSSAFRFHPIEIVVSLAFKALLAALLAPPFAAVLAFEAIVVWASMWDHVNWSLPRVWERRVRWLFVTPRLHLVHHSKARIESQRNYGNALILWDRWLGTYLAQSERGDAPPSGIEGLDAPLARDPRHVLVDIPLAPPR